MPGQELCLLSLDGGGVRGLSTLQILRQLMETIDPESPPKPCEYFDMIGGTSTGGLLAIMLGRLQMSIDECTDAYITLSERIFQKRRHRVNVRGQVQARFDSEELGRAIKEIVAQQGLNEDALLKDSPDAKCKVFVCATSQETGDTVHLTSYRSRGPEHLLRKTTMWEAGRAASAASTFFDSIAIGDFGEVFTDGATGANNPVAEVWNEAKDIWPREPFEDNIKCLISIGTGVPSLTPFGKNVLEIGQALLAIATETEKTAERFARDKARLGDEGRYFRFSVLRGLEDIGLEEYKQKNAVVAATSRYIQSQDVHRQMKACGNNLAEREYVGSYRIPFSLTGVPTIDNFIHRPWEMEKLENDLLPRRRSERRKILILHGLGGIGKTQLSIEFARKHSRRFSSTFWLDGRTEDSIRQGLAAISRRLPQDQIPEATRSYTHGSGDELDRAIRDVLDWFMHESNNSWLLIFDNVDRDYLSIGKEVGAYNVEDYFPGGDHGSILVTTRLAKLGQIGKLSLKLRALDETQARKMMENNLNRPFEDSNESKELLEELAGLPLAITQSAAFMRETGLTAAKYLSLYRKEWNELADDTPLRSYPNGSIQNTWMVSYEAIKKRNEIAANLMRLWAYFDYKDLWYGLFSGVPKRSSLWGILPSWFQEMVSSELKFTKAIRELLAFSMIEAREDVSAYSVHPVVHEWAFQVLGKERTNESFWLAVMIVGRAIPESHERESWIMQQRLIPHVDCCYRGIERGEGGKMSQKDDGSEVDETAKEYFHAVHMFGYLYARQDKLEKAEKMYMRALKGTEKAFGVGHRVTLSTVNSLSILYSDQGDLEKAEEWRLRALEGYEKTLGVEHMATLNIVNNLGTLYAVQKKLEKAEKMFMRVLKGYKTLGIEDAFALGTINNNLGRIYADQGKLEEAEQVYMLALKRYEKTLGDEHPTTLITVDNLGKLYTAQSKPEKAEEMYMRVLRGKENTLGDEHTSTLGTVNNLANLYTNQNQFEKAEKMYMRVLKGYKKALSAEHIRTLEILDNLGHLYTVQGKLEEAEEMQIRALKGKEKSLGDEHTSTLGTVNNLANLYINQNQFEKAEKMYMRVLKGLKKALSAEHIWTLETLGNLGILYTVQGKLEEAEEMQVRALKGKEKSLSAGHPSTLTTVDNLAVVYRGQGDLEKAGALLNRFTKYRTF